jgi:hypothetical protein
MITETLFWRRFACYTILVANSAAMGGRPGRISKSGDSFGPYGGLLYPRSSRTARTPVPEGRKMKLMNRWPRASRSQPGAGELTTSVYTHANLP